MRLTLKVIDMAADFVRRNDCKEVILALPWAERRADGICSRRSQDAAGGGAAAS